MRMGRCKQTQKPNAAAVVAVLVLVLLAAATAAGGAGGAGLISLRVYDQVEIEADQIHLGKIARIDGDDAGLVRDLEALVIGRSPLPGKSRSLDSAASTLPGSSCRSPRRYRSAAGRSRSAASASNRS
jgi:hypothetical protein